MNMTMKTTSDCQIRKESFSSVFKKTEEFFRKNPDCEKLIIFLSLQKEKDSYASVSDLFFCRLFPEWKKQCFAYYKGRGPKLREILPERCIRKCDEAMLATLRALKQTADGSF